MTSVTHRGNSLDKLDKRILLALEDDALSAKDICDEWALPTSDEARIRYRIRERLGHGEGRLVQIYTAEEVPGGLPDRNIYGLTDPGKDFVRLHREVLTTPEDIDDLCERINDAHDRADSAYAEAKSAEAVANKQRERINDLQRDKHAINERSKENRKRLRKLEDEVFETKWEPSLRQRLDEIREGSKKRDEELEHDLDVMERRLRRTLATRSDLRDVERAAQEGANGVTALSDEIQELKERLDETEKENRRLRVRVAELEQEKQKSRITRWLRVISVVSVVFSPQTR